MKDKIEALEAQIPKVVTANTTVTLSTVGWQVPIHQLLIKHYVNVVFHGHDHFFAKQTLDGIVYQLLPQLGAFRYGNANSAKEYGYTSGTILNNPGYLRVHISSNKAIVDYVQTSTNNQYKNKEVLISYTINP